MVDRKRQHDTALVDDLANQPIIADAIAPESSERALQGFAETTWIVLGHQALANEGANTPLRRAIQTPNLSLRPIG